MKNQNSNPVISVGVINITTGNTMYDWSIYENKGLQAYLTSDGFLLLGCDNSFKVGDRYDLVGNDSQRSLGKRGEIISDCSCEDKDKFIAWLKSYDYDYSPLRSFKSRPKGNKKLITSYSLK